MPPSMIEMNAMVEAAVRAPSSHNTQPWLFEVKPGCVDVWADRTRALPVNDPFDRELTISCGAALFNLELAAWSLGFEPIVASFPDPSDLDCVARVTFGTATSESAVRRKLYATIDLRHTTREPFAPDDLADLRPALAAAAGDHDVHLLLDVDREMLAEFVAEGDRAQFADPHWRRELASWMHPRRRGEGLAVPEILGLASRAVVTVANLGKSTARSDAGLIAAAPLVAVLTTDTDDANCWLEAGRALQHLLLVAAAEGVQAGYENQPCQVAAVRSRFDAALGGQGFAQLIVRLGRHDHQRYRSPRRPLDAVLIA